MSYIICQKLNSGADQEDLAKWKKEIQVSFKERNWVSMPITELGDDLEKQIYIDSRTLIGAISDMERKVEAQVQEIIDLKVIIREQNKTIQNLQADMDRQTTLLEKLVQAVIPDAVSERQENVEPICDHHVMSWDEVANTLKEASMDRLIFLWHNLQGETSFRRLDKSAQAKHKTKKNRYAAVTRFMCEVAGVEIASKPHGTVQLLEWKKFLSECSSRAFNNVFRILSDASCFKGKGTEEKRKMSFSKLRDAIVLYNKQSKNKRKRDDSDDLNN